MSCDDYSAYRSETAERFKSVRKQLGLSDRQLLERLLAQIYVSNEAKQRAESLFEHFGSFDSIIGAESDELAASGIVNSEGAKLIKTVNRGVNGAVSVLTAGVSLLDNEGIKKAVRSCFFGEKEEKLRIFPVGEDMRLLPCCVIAEGSEHRSETVGPEVIAKLAEYGCSDFFIAHNHVGGRLLPSDSDVRFTRILNRELRENGLRLLDHFITAENDICSLRELGLFFDYE